MPDMALRSSRGGGGETAMAREKSIFAQMSRGASDAASTPDYVPPTRK